MGYVRVRLADNAPSENSNAKGLDSNVVVKKARREVNRVLQLPQEQLSVEGRYVERGQARKGFLVAVNQFPSIADLEAQLQELEALVEKRQALLAEVTTRLDALVVSDEKLREQALLKKASVGYRDVILRHIVESVGAKLQIKFRPQREGEHWTMYILAIHKDNKQWFAEREFDVNINLLLNGQSTLGNDAAPAPTDVEVDKFVASEPTWARLWRFAKTGD